LRKVDPAFPVGKNSTGRPSKSKKFPRRLKDEKKMLLS